MTWTTRVIPQLRAEAREKFDRAFSLISLGQAGRISGINPADIATLLIHLKRAQRRPRPIGAAANRNDPLPRCLPETP